MLSVPSSSVRKCNSPVKELTDTERQLADLVNRMMDYDCHFEHDLIFDTHRLMHSLGFPGYDPDTGEYRNELVEPPIGA